MQWNIITAVPTEGRAPKRPCRSVVNARPPFPGFVLLYGPVYLPLRVFSLVPLINFFHTLSHSEAKVERAKPRGQPRTHSLARAAGKNALCTQ